MLSDRHDPAAKKSTLWNSVPSKNTGRAITFAAHEHEVAAAIMRLSPVAADNLLYRSQQLPADRP